MSEAFSNPTQKPIRCLVIQLARLGDTLQSLMALRAAQQLYPNLEIHFVARARFADAAKRVPWVKSVVTLPTDTLLMPVLKGTKSETQALADVARWIAPLVKDSWDMIVNWSFSDASSYLTGILPAKIKLGYTRRRDGSFSGADGWSHYIQGIVQGQISQNIHLTDILTTQLLTALQIHYGEPVADGNAPVTSKGFFSLEMGEHEIGLQWGDVTRKWIGIQLGAGQAAKTWGTRSWAKLAANILNRHPECSIVLLGGKEDEGKARDFLSSLKEMTANSRYVVSLVGQTSFDLWASVVGRCQWIFAADTAAIHLASVLGTRVFNVSVGPVRWSETGPYGNGHYVVCSARPCEGCEKKVTRTNEGHTCCDLVTAEAVYSAWSYACHEWAHRRQIPLSTHAIQLGWGNHLSQVRVFRSKIRNTADGGGVLYEPLTPDSVRLSDWTAMMMGHVARAWYCGWVPPVGQEMVRESISTKLVQEIRELAEPAEVMTKICEEARKTALLLNQRSSLLKSEKVMGIRERDELRDLGKKLMDLDTLIERMGKTHAALLGFSHMTKVLMHNLRGTGLSELGKESADCYRQIGDGIRMLREWIATTLALAKPVAIKPSATKELLT